MEEEGSGDDAAAGAVKGYGLPIEEVAVLGGAARKEARNSGVTGE